MTEKFLILSLAEEKNINKFFADDKIISLVGDESSLSEAFARFLFNKRVSFIVNTDSDNPKNIFMGIKYIHIDDITPEQTKESTFLLCGNITADIVNKLSSKEIGEVFVCIQLDEDAKLLLENQAAIKNVRATLSDEKSKHVFNSIINKRLNGINDYSDICESNQYFNEIFQRHITDEEIYLDLGTLNLDSISLFVRFVNNKYKKIYAFEPTKKNYQLIYDALAHNPKIAVYPYAVSHQSGEMNLLINPYSNGNSLLLTASKDDYEIVKSITLDEFISDKVTFIKIDIEGAEQLAIFGAMKLIKKYRPKLAISIYHLPLDILQIPQFIHSLVPEYKLFIRHHYSDSCETILYAYVDEEQKPSDAVIHNEHEKRGINLSQAESYLQQAQEYVKQFEDLQGINKGTIFFDTGNGFNDDEKILLSFKLCENNRFSHYVEIPLDVKAVRFDPIEGKACLLKDVEIISNNGKLAYKNLVGLSINGLEIFKCTDPQILIETEGKSIHFIKIEGQLLTFGIDELAFINKLDELSSLCFREK